MRKTIIMALCVMATYKAFGQSAPLMNWPLDSATISKYHIYYDSNYGFKKPNNVINITEFSAFTVGNCAIVYNYTKGNTNITIVKSAIHKYKIISYFKTVKYGARNLIKQTITLIK